MAIGVKQTAELLDITPHRVKQILKENSDLNYYRAKEKSGKIIIPSETIKKILAYRGKSLKQNNIVIKSEKGGVGGSTLTIQTAIRVASKYGAKTLIIDCDGECNASSFLLDDDFDYSKAKSMLEVFKHDIPLEECIVPTRFDNVYLVPSKSILRRVDRLIQNENPKTLMKEKLESIRHLGFDTIFMDLPPTFSTLSASCYLATTMTILPTDSSAWGIEGVMLTYEDILEECKKFEANVPEIKILMNKFSPNRKASVDAWRTMIIEFGGKVLPFQVKESTALMNANNEGLSIFETRCPTDIKNAIDELAFHTCPVIEKTIQ